MRRKKPVDPTVPPKPLRALTAEEWAEWYRDLRVAVDDMRAVAEDRLRRKRKRDLGIAEAKRLYEDADDKIERLFARVEGGDGGDDEGGRDPAGLGGSPAH